MYLVSDYAHLGHPKKNLSRSSPTRVLQLHLFLHFLFTWCFLNNRSRHWWKIEIGPCQNSSVSLCQFTEKWGPLLCDDHLCVHRALTTPLKSEKKEQFWEVTFALVLNFFNGEALAVLSNLYYIVWLLQRSKWFVYQILKIVKKNPFLGRIFEINFHGNYMHNIM